MYLLYVSIPYGKGKEDLGIIRTGLEFITYQFPMGKVKKINNGRRILYETYQFPMGKVKAW